MDTPLPLWWTVNPTGVPTFLHDVHFVVEGRPGLISDREPREGQVSDETRGIT